MNQDALTPMRIPRMRASWNELPEPSMLPSSHRPDQ
jgi:hypothetical protein